MEHVSLEENLRNIKDFHGMLNEEIILGSNKGLSQAFCEIEEALDLQEKKMEYCELKSKEIIDRISKLLGMMDSMNGQ